MEDIRTHTLQSRHEHWRQQVEKRLEECPHARLEHIIYDIPASFTNCHYVDEFKDTEAQTLTHTHTRRDGEQQAGEGWASEPTARILSKLDLLVSPPTYGDNHTHAHTQFSFFQIKIV